MIGSANIGATNYRFEGRNMKYLKQLLLILLITLVGEILKYLIPLSIPASIYGMIILFLCLMTGTVKLEDVKETGTFMIEIMPVMFIPAGVGLITSWEVLKTMLVPVCLVTFITLLTVMVATGRISQSVIKKERGDRHE